MQSWYKWGSAGQSMSHRHVKLALAPDSRLCELVLAIISSTPHDFAVMTAQTVALDETVASKPEIIEWWLQGAHNFPNPTWPDERLIHQYFHELPFFDWTSKNGAAMLQARSDLPSWNRVHDRKAFEDILRRQIGTEYVIVGEPQPIPGDEKGRTNGMWVIRKLDRIPQPRHSEANPYPETELLETYYFIGGNVYKAPSVADVVANRMLNVTTNLSRFFERAKRLPTFSPTTGHTYLPHKSKRETAAGSNAASPARSREGSLAPGAETQSLRSGSLLQDGHAASGDFPVMANSQDAKLLMQSLSMAIQFGDEYMDENPLLGEPGNFKFTSTSAAVKKRKADEEAAAAAKAREQKESTVSQMSSAKDTPQPEKVPSPPAIFTEAKTSAKKESKEERKKRRKSRPNATSPNTPASVSSILPPSGG